MYVDNLHSMLNSWTISNMRGRLNSWTTRNMRGRLNNWTGNMRGIKIKRYKKGYWRNYRQ